MYTYNPNSLPTYYTEDGYMTKNITKTLKN